MQRDAHYYAILAFCRACGFRKKSAYKVAYASQFVDDAKINHIILSEDPKGLECRYVDSKPVIANMATSHHYFRASTLNYDSMINNTVAFHFVPGCRGSSFEKKLRCRERSPVVVALLEEALSSGDLVKFGVVLHAYADTYTHQGFSGILSKVNDIVIPVRKLPVFKLFPDDIASWVDEMVDKGAIAYGHAQALHKPDIPLATWEYSYDESDDFIGDYVSTRIVNQERFERGFDSISKYIKAFLRKHLYHRDKGMKFRNFDLLRETLFTPGDLLEREEAWRQMLVEEQLFNTGDRALSYCEEQWLIDAFSNYDSKQFDNRTVEGAVPDEFFVWSDWLHFVRATIWYKERFYYYCEQNGLYIPQ